MLSEKVKFILALAPAADRFNTNPATDVISGSLSEEITFLVHHDGGTTGKATLTVEACDDFVPSATSAIAFKYRKTRVSAGLDYDAASATIGSATSAGIDTTPAEHEVVEVFIKTDELPAGYPNVRLKLTEAVNDPVSGSVVAVLSKCRYQGLVTPTAIS